MHHFQMKLEVQVAEVHYLIGLVHVTGVHFIQDGSEGSNIHLVLTIETEGETFLSDADEQALKVDSKFLNHISH